MTGLALWLLLGVLLRPIGFAWLAWALAALAGAGWVLGQRWPRPGSRSDVTEHFLVGSFASWLAALGSVGLILLTPG